MNTTINEERATAKDFFLYLAILISLYVSVFSLVKLLFETIDYAFPDQLSYVDPYSSAIRWAVASLIIMFPLFGIFSRLVGKEIATRPGKKEISFRKWFIFITLFLTGLAMAIDLIALIYTFLDGEITTRFILKVLVLIVAAGLVFLYYFRDMRGRIMRGSRWFTLAALIVVASVVAGFTVMGSPSVAREKRFDERRVQDLQSIQWQIVNFWQQKGKLPAKLEDLNDPISSFMVPTDPRTGTAYEYRITDQTKLGFELCADFETEGVNNSLTPYATKPMAPGEVPDTWTHSAEKTCFERTIDPELYPQAPTKARQ